jgi:hypothetical protein
MPQTQTSNQPQGPSLESWTPKPLVLSLESAPWARILKIRGFSSTGLAILTAEVSTF